MGTSSKGKARFAPQLISTKPLKAWLKGQARKRRKAEKKDKVVILQ